MNEVSEKDERTAHIKRAAYDAEMHQGELSGGIAGRQLRLPQRAERDKARREERTPEQQALTRALDLLLATDPIYRAAYQKTWAALTQAEAETQDAIDRLEHHIQNETERLIMLEDQAATLPDGTPVFRAADGTIRTKDGRDVSHLADHIMWRVDEPSWEAYAQQGDRVSDLQDRLYAWRHYQIDVLGTARDSMTDADSPPDHQELDDLLKDIEELAPNRMERDLVPAPEIAANSGVSATAIPAL